jgi:hypothetical protein
MGSIDWCILKLAEAWLITLIESIYKRLEMDIVSTILPCFALHFSNTSRRVVVHENGNADIRNDSLPRPEACQTLVTVMPALTA